MHNGLAILKFNFSCHQCGESFNLSIHRYASDIAIKQRISEIYKIPMKDVIIMLDSVPIANMFIHADTGIILDILCTKQHGLDISKCISRYPPLPPLSFMEYNGCGTNLHYDLDCFCRGMMAINGFEHFGIYADVRNIIKRLFMVISLWESNSVMEYAYNLVLEYIKPLKPNLKARGIKQRAIKMGLCKNVSAGKINKEIRRVKGMYNV